MSDLVERLRFQGRYGAERNDDMAARKISERQEAASLIERQAALIEEAREALRFYAEEHDRPNEGPWGVDSTDFGDVARAALRCLEKSNGR